MNFSAQPGTDLVPLGERMRMISAFRAFAIAVIAGAWLTVPSTRAMEAVPAVAIIVAYLAATFAVEYVWRRSQRRVRMLFGLFAMADGVVLAWASYGSTGLDSPLMYLIVVQLITVSLLASFRTGLKLALFSSTLLLLAVHLQEIGALDALGGQTVAFGDATYADAIVKVALFFAVAVTTTAFAATNERELRRRRYDLEALAKFAIDLERDEDPADVAGSLLDAVAGTYGCEPSVVVRADGDELELLATRDAGGSIDAPARRLGPASTKALRELIDAGQTRLVARREHGDDAILEHFSRRANVAVVPLRDHSGAITGALIAEYPAARGTRIERRTVSMLERLSAHASLALENADLLDRIRLMAMRDALTGLPNRRELSRMLEATCARAERGRDPVSVVMVDIDHFKKLNDTYGHQVGDEVLQAVAAALERDLRPGDLAARYGGEEFSIVLPGLDTREAVGVAERVRARIEALPVQMAVTASLGVASAPDHGSGPQDLLEAADAALYRAKAGGRNQVVAATAGRAESHVPAA